MSDLKLQITKTNKYQTNNFPYQYENISKISNKYQRIKIPAKEYKNNILKDPNERNYKRGSPFLKFSPFENQELFVNSKGNVEYIYHNEDYNESEDDFYQRNSDIYLRKRNYENLNKCQNEKYPLSNKKIYQIYYSKEILNTQPNTCKKIVKYLSPESKNGNHKKIRYKNEYDYRWKNQKNNTYNNSNENIMTNMKTSNTTVNIYSNNVENTSNYSNKNERIYSNINSKSSNYNNNSIDNNAILNKNNKGGNRRTFSYNDKSKKNQNTKRNTTTKLFLFKNNRDYSNIENEFIKSKSFDGKYLKMQNSQNLQIIQDEKLYQILLPIPPNEIDYNCNFSIPRDNLRKRKKNNNNYSSNIKNRPIMNNDIDDKESNNSQKNFNTNMTYSKKLIKKNKINKEDFIINNFSLNIKETGRKFQNEMKIIKTDLNYYEGKTRNWNDIIKPNNEPYFTIERLKNKEKNLSENNVQKFCYKGKIVRNWNSTNDKQKMDNICIYKNKNSKNINLFKQKGAFFTIKGKGKNWNNILVIQQEINHNIEPNINENKKIIKKKKMVEYEVNLRYTEKISNIKKKTLYRESLTNREIFIKNKNENEYNENIEGSSINEESQNLESPSPQNKMRSEYREQIILYNTKYQGKIPIKSENNSVNDYNFQKSNSEIHVEENEMDQSQSNKSNIYRSQKLHIDYIFKNDFNSSIKNNKDEKSKTFIKQINYSEVKPESSVEMDYDINFPEPDKLNQIKKRESEHSNLTENLGSLKENVENINIHNSSLVIKDNNLNKKIISRSSMREENADN